MIPSIPQLLKQHGLRPRKGLGQNFLIIPDTAQRIVTAAGLTPEVAAVEIGPGLGSLTAPLLAAAGEVWAVEKDTSLLPLLEERVGSLGTLHIIHHDALTHDFAALSHTLGKPLVVVANLPYNISTPILFHLLGQRQAIRRLVLMFQKEVAARLAAAPGSRDYGALSVACQLWCHIQPVLQVPPGAFFPPPKVHSAVVRLDVREQPAVPVASPERFMAVVKAAFGQRRKTLGNALKTLTPETAAWLARAEIDPQRRGETLTLAEFARLSDLFPAP